MRAAVPLRELELPDNLAETSDGGDEPTDERLDDVPGVLRLRYRLGEEPGPPRPRHEVARLLGLTLAQVREEEGRAMRQMRRRLAKVVHRAPAEGADPP